MEIESTSPQGGKRARPQQQKSKDAPVKKDLLRLERDIYQLKKPQEAESDFVIRKLMAKKEKPQIGILQQSPLLSRLKQLMPIFNKSNEELFQRPIEQSEKIDVQLEECESSSSSDSESESEEKKTQKLNSKIHDMEIQQTNNSSQSDMHTHMQNEAEEAVVNQVQINFLRYPYLNQQMIAQLEKEKLQKPKQEQEKKQKQKKKVLIEEISPK